MLLLLLVNPQRLKYIKLFPNCFPVALVVSTCPFCVRLARIVVLEHNASISCIYPSTVRMYTLLASGHLRLASYVWAIR